MSENNPMIIPGGVIEAPAGIISPAEGGCASALGDEFAKEIAENMVADFKKDGDMMVHVSTFVFIGGMIYMTYYANPTTAAENPVYQTARLAYCPVSEPEKKTYLDLQAVGEKCAGRTVDAVYDTILMNKDDETLYLMWTARLSGDYYRLYRTFTVSTGELGETRVNRLSVGDMEVDFCFSGIQRIFTEAGLGYKTMYSDIGIMQKLTSRVENGVRYYYSGAYSGDFNFIIKSADLVNWRYVAMPDFVNQSKWENAVYVIGDRCFYFVRQGESQYGFLTCYDLNKGSWDKPVLVGDCQSRSDFIMYGGKLYLFHAPIDREHIGILRVNTESMKDSEVVLTAKMRESCFYPFVQYGNGGLYMSYTSDRRHIRLSCFTPEKYFI